MRISHSVAFQDNKIKRDNKKFANNKKILIFQIWDLNYGPPPNVLNNKEQFGFHYNSAVIKKKVIPVFRIRFPKPSYCILEVNE